MTACVAIKVNQGLVFASDSRTNSGVDYIRTYSKMHRFCLPGYCSLIILSSGNLATTQAVINRIQHDLDDPSSSFNLFKARKLYEIAHYIGGLSQEEQLQHASAFRDRSALEATFIIGGQIGSCEDDIHLVYPEGNYITVSPETPYLQIGETKYGKPILDRIITPATELNNAARCALVSLDSTMRSNVSVGPPLEIAIYMADSLCEPRYLKFCLDTPLYTNIQTSWAQGLQQAFQSLPRFDWE